MPFRSRNLTGRKVPSGINIIFARARFLEGTSITCQVSCEVFRVNTVNGQRSISEIVPEKLKYHTDNGGI